MHSESGGGDDDDDDDDKLVRVRLHNSDRDSSSTGWRSSLGSSFQRQRQWRKERLLTFKEEYKGGRARVTASQETLLGWG